MARIITVRIKAFPEDADDEDVAEFVHSALTSMGGCLRPPGGLGPEDPGDPMFGSLNVETVKIGSKTFSWE